MDLEVVIPTHASPADRLERAVESALACNARRVLVVVDGRSAVEGLVDPRVEVVRREAAGGPSAARNAGLERARGDWVALLDDDDALRPAGVAAAVARAEALGAVACCSPRVEVRGEEERVRAMPADWAGPALPGWWSCFRPTTLMGCSGWVLRGDVARGERFDEGLWIGEDRDFFARVARRGAVALGEEPASRCTMRADGNLSSAAHLHRRVRDHITLVDRWWGRESERDLRVATAWLVNQCARARVEEGVWRALADLCARRGWPMPMKARLRRVLRGARVGAGA